MGGLGYVGRCGALFWVDKAEKGVSGALFLWVEVGGVLFWVGGGESR